MEKTQLQLHTVKPFYKDICGMNNEITVKPL